MVGPPEVRLRVLPLTRPARLRAAVPVHTVCRPRVTSKGKLSSSPFAFTSTIQFPNRCRVEAALIKQPWARPTNVNVYSLNRRRSKAVTALCARAPDLPDAEFGFGSCADLGLSSDGPSPAGDCCNCYNCCSASARALASPRCAHATADRPPSTPMICPVTQLASFESKK